MLGCIEGDIDGLLVGCNGLFVAEVGDIDDVMDGIIDGYMVGVVVGVNDGYNATVAAVCVGLNVCVMDGCIVGDAVGIFVGDMDGLYDGVCVGCSDDVVGVFDDDMGGFNADEIDALMDMNVMCILIDVLGCSEGDNVGV
eukprot:312715_1